MRPSCAGKASWYAMPWSASAVWAVMRPCPCGPLWAPRNSGPSATRWNSPSALPTAAACAWVCADAAACGCCRCPAVPCRPARGWSWSRPAPIWPPAAACPPMCRRAAPPRKAVCGPGRKRIAGAAPGGNVRLRKTAVSGDSWWCATAGPIPLRHRPPRTMPRDAAGGSPASPARAGGTAPYRGPYGPGTAGRLPVRPGLRP